MCGPDRPQARKKARRKFAIGTRPAAAKS